MRRQLGRVAPGVRAARARRAGDSETLHEMLTAGSPATRREAVEECGRFRSVPSSLVHALIGATVDEEPAVRRAAVIALGRTADHRDEVVHALTRSTMDEHDHVVLYALLALGRVRALEAIPRLEQALADQKKLIRAYAAEGLSEMKHRRAWPALLRAAEDKDGDVFTHALFGLHTLLQPGDERELGRLAHRLSGRRRRKIERLIRLLESMES